MIKKILEKQPTETEPVTIDNYPYGYTLRTQIKYWVETTRNGQRFAHQTLNPKTGAWNKPKKSTYSNIVLIGIDEEDHITYTSLSVYSLEEAQRFKERYESFLSEYQRTELTNVIKMLEVYDKVEYTIKTRKFRNILTGEITESVDIMHLSEYEEVTEDNGFIAPVDPEQERKKQTELTHEINKYAILNASTETGLKSALDTFKRL